MMLKKLTSIAALILCSLSSVATAAPTLMTDNQLSHVAGGSIITQINVALVDLVDINTAIAVNTAAVVASPGAIVNQNANAYTIQANTSVANLLNSVSF